jgi:hypothetical protein
MAGTRLPGVPGAWWQARQAATRLHYYRMGSCGHSLHHAAGMQDGYYLSYYYYYYMVYLPAAGTAVLVATIASAVQARLRINTTASSLTVCYKGCDMG